MRWLLLMMVALPTAAFAQSAMLDHHSFYGVPPQWKQCAQDSDCIILKGKRGRCDYETVNKNYQKEGDDEIVNNRNEHLGLCGNSTGTNPGSWIALQVFKIETIWERIFPPSPVAKCVANQCVAEWPK